MTLDSSFMPSWTECLDWTIRATLVFVAAGVANWGLRNRSAAARHLVWSAALLGALLLPLVKWTIPGWDLPKWSTAVPTSSHQHRWLAYHRDASPSFDAAVHEIVGRGDEPVSDWDGAQPIAAASGESRRVVHSSFPAVHKKIPLLFVAVIWSVGCGAMLTGVIAGALSLWRLRRTSQPLPREMDQELQQLARDLGIRRRVAGLITRSRSIPMTWGALHPIVLLPVESATWPRERRRMVLLHELAHVRRWDFAIQLLGQVSRAVHWFNPMAWWALSCLRLEQERACDDCVLNAGESAADYATELVTITARLPRYSWDSAVALAIRRLARIERRLLAILDGTLDRRPLGVAWSAAWAVALTVSISLVTVPRWPRVQAQEQKAAAANPQTKAAPGAAQKQKAGDQAPATNEPTLTKIRDLIRQESADEVDLQRLTEGAIQGMLKSLQDPHSALMSRDEFREFQVLQQGQIVGIGAQLAKEQEQIVIVVALPNSPALKAGLKSRDVILSIDQAKVSDLKSAVNAIRGPKGSEVTLHIRRDGKEFDLTVVRDVVLLEAVRGLALDAAGKWRYDLDAAAKVSYLQITEFNQRTADELAAALAQLQQQGINGLILDLRGCPGGLLESSVRATSLFVKSGTVATVRGRQRPPDEKFEVDGTAKYPDLPLVVVVDDQTASAAEVFVAALQDHRRAIVVGERTHGKGSVQSLIPVSELDTSLKLTTAQMYRSSGLRLDRTKDSATWGVDANDGFFVPITANQRAAFHERRAQRQLLGQLQLPETLTPEQIVSELADPVLAAAFQTLVGKLKTGEFAPTGRPLSEMQAELAGREALRAERDKLLEKLRLIDEQLGKPR